MDMDLIEAFLRFVLNKVLEKCPKELAMIERNVEKLQKATQPFTRITYEEAIQILKGKKTVNGKNAIEVLENDLKEINAAIEANKKEIEERESAISKPGMKKGEINFNMAKIGKLKAETKTLEERAENIPTWIKSAENFVDGNDLGGSDETVITRLFDTPIMIYNWPHEVKAFYMKRDEKDARWAKGVDVLAPEGYGEIVGGGERETNLELLIEKIKEHKLPMEAFEWYLDLRRYGSVKHAGFGLGLERLVAYVCGLPHVRETVPFPRMYGRLLP
jgi:asparaginyl-tRNA synthetase